MTETQIAVIVYVLVFLALQQLLKLVTLATKLNPNYHPALHQLAMILKDSNQPNAGKLAAEVLKRATNCKGISSQV